MFKNKKVLIISLLLIAGLSIGAWWVFVRDTSSDLPVADTSEPVNYDPPTETDKTESDSKKDQIVDEDTNQTTDTSTDSIKKTNVTITYWGASGSSYEVGAYASHVEQSGTCTLTMKKGTTTLTAARKATINVSTMSCGALSVSNAKVTPGMWSATVKYSSDKYQGSTTKQIEVE
jgi:cytoskeletal protein RodZ